MGLALFNILPGRLVNGAQAPNPASKVNVAGIGIGSQGGRDVDEVAGLGHNIVALCDVDENYAAKEFAKYPGAKRFTDYRVHGGQRYDRSRITWRSELSSRPGPAHGAARR